MKINSIFGCDSWSEAWARRELLHLIGCAIDLTGVKKIKEYINLQCMCFHVPKNMSFSHSSDVAMTHSGWQAAKDD